MSNFISYVLIMVGCFLMGVGVTLSLLNGHIS